MKQKTTKKGIRQDELWKGIIQDLFEPFMHYFYADFVHEINFNQPFEFLDKDLQLIFKELDTESINRRADVLVKVHLKDGQEKWLLVHIEVQGYEDKEFALRMYIYQYRIFDRHGKRVTALAILTDANPNFRPSHYEFKTWNTNIRYDYGMFKVLDYDMEYFEKSGNPFASVMFVARTYLANNDIKSDKDLLKLKIQLFKTMLKKGHSKGIITKITHFIKHYVRFDNKDFFRKFDKQTDVISKNQGSMGIIELVTKHREEEIFQEALEQGIEKGEEKGIEKGISLERRNTITNLLKHDFTIDEIIKLMNYERKQVEQVALEWNIEKLLKARKSIAFVQQKLELDDIKMIVNIQEKLNAKD